MTDLLVKKEEYEITEIEEYVYRERINFLGYVFCPIKKMFRDHFDRVAEEYIRKSGNTAFSYYVPSGCSTSDPYENIWKAESAEQLPDIIASVGFGDFFRKEFSEHFIDTGCFGEVPRKKPLPLFSQFEDPRHCYTVYSLFPKIFMIDKKKLGTLPVPSSWSDLLDPIYKDNIVIGAAHGDINEELLYYIYKEHGEEGLEALASNVKHGWHGSKMSRIAGTANSDGAAVYVISVFFAKSCPKKERTLLVWPEDGAIPTINYVLAKRDSINKYRSFTDFITGSDFGQEIADNCFPSLNPNVDNKLPREASFKWLGWDYIRKNNMAELKKEVMDIFYSVLRKKTGFGEISL